MRFVFGGVGLALAVASGLGYVYRPEKPTLERDTANPFRWAERGEALADAGQTERARACFQRALELAPNVPFIWLRYTNFSLMAGDSSSALSSAARVMRTVPDYDGILFNYLDSSVNDPQRVLGAIGDNKRATRAWLQHMEATKNAAGARAAWAEVRRRGYADDSLANGYVDYLNNGQLWDEALATRAAWLGGQARGSYPDRNLIYNGEFKSAIKPGLDWVITPVEGEVESRVEGSAAVLRFLGQANVNFDGLSQVVILPAAGRYHLSARFKTEDITTNEGVRLAVPELNLVSESLGGSQPWTDVGLDFSVPAGRQVRVAVVRRVSQKFDNKITGRVWVTGFSLVRVG